MSLDLSQTIVAAGSGVLPAKRAVVRISGSKTRELLDCVVQFANQDSKNTFLDARRAIQTKCQFEIWLRASSNSDESTRTMQVPGQCYWWPDHRSFTGEPAAELHLVGSPPLVEALIESLQVAGARLAQRGEFTLRSFLAGRIDLAQAEAVLGVIEAQDDNQLSEALGQLAGNLSKPIASLRHELMELTAHMEAGLDFIEEDIEFISSDALESGLLTISERLAEISQRLISRGARERFARVVLVGAPNAGKSTLFNRLLKSERAIVSELAGTTRDAVTSKTVFRDLQVELVDVAGLEEFDPSTPRGLAQEMVDSELQRADLLVHCVDLTLPSNEDLTVITDPRLVDLPHLLVGTKADLVPAFPSDCADIDQSASNYRPWDTVVRQDDERTIEQLWEVIYERVGGQSAELQTEGMHHAMLRSYESIENARQSLEEAMDINQQSLGDELVTSELRIAIDQLGSVIGAVHTEDILGEIFGRFCIGK